MLSRWALRAWYAPASAASVLLAGLAALWWMDAERVGFIQSAFGVELHEFGHAARTIVRKACVVAGAVLLWSVLDRVWLPHLRIEECWDDGPEMRERIVSGYMLVAAAAILGFSLA